jgi:hypothetical protein
LGDFRALEIFPLFFQALGKLAMTSSKAWEKGGELFQILMDTTKAAAHQKPPCGGATNDTDRAGIVCSAPVRAFFPTFVVTMKPWKTRVADCGAMT